MTARTRPIPTGRSEDAFERLLGDAARSLVVAALPADVIDVPRSAVGRSSLRLDMPLAAMVAMAVVGLLLATGAPRAHVAGQPSTFVSGTQISYALRSSGYDCQPGAAAPAGRSRMDAVLCTTHVGTSDATVIVSEDPTGRVGEVHIDIRTGGSATTTLDADGLMLLQDMIGLPLMDAASGSAARAWLAGVLPLGPGSEARATIAGTPVVLTRVADGEYRIVLGDLAAGRSPVPPS